MLELFPEGFEEVESGIDVELAAYTDASGEERLWHAFGGVRSADVEDGWEERWKAFHRPVRIGPLWVGPPWEAAPPDLVPVVIEPGRAFGTGAHATTRLCLELLVHLPRGGLLDVGCGSGVLAIAASKLGFAPVTAIDVDPLAVEATARNAAANDVSVDVSTVAAEDESPAVADVVLANISLGAVEDLVPRLVCDNFVSSGYLVSDGVEVHGYRRVRRVESEGWAADLWKPETQ